LGRRSECGRGELDCNSGIEPMFKHQTNRNQQKNGCRPDNDSTARPPFMWQLTR
jgi:hypothetical protein